MAMMLCIEFYIIYVIYITLSRMAKNGVIPPIFGHEFIKNNQNNSYIDTI